MCMYVCIHEYVDVCENYSLQSDMNMKMNREEYMRRFAKKK